MNRQAAILLVALAAAPQPCLAVTKAACVATAAKLLDAIRRDDLPGAYSRFSGELKSHKPDRMFREVMRELDEEFGRIDHFGKPTSSTRRGATTVITPVHFEKGVLNAWVTCDRNAKVDDFHFVPSR